MSSVAGVAESFTPDGLQTVAGGSVPADLVIYATGFDRRYDYLPPDVLKGLKQTEEGIPLYRDTLPTDVEVRQHKFWSSRHSYYCRRFQIMF